MVNDEITEKIIACAFTGMNTLGAGFLEKVYENSMVIELEKNGFNVKQQVPIHVFYDKKIVKVFGARMRVLKSIVNCF